MNRLPPLRALQIFDAVIRYGSAVAAAEALHVTPGAISQQIRVLEDFLGVTLFDRENTGLRPTPLCELYHSHISRGFECFHDAQAALKAQTGRRLTLMTFPSVATHWLASRLDKWHAICPYVQVHVEVVDHETNIGARSADVRLTYGAPPDDGTPYHIVFTDRVAPVCAPSLLQSEAPISQPADILRYPLIHVEWGWGKMSPPTWKDWFHAVGVPLPEVLAPLTYSVSGMAIDAAIRGRGISLGQGFFAIDSIKRHDLVLPFKIALPMPFPYFICWKQSVADSPIARQFLDWLIGEAEQAGRDITAMFG
ncbi:LysR family transcriptional regulator [Trinickia violacea]|uniref:LysR family transcriptional regulator n=1 Tax=Trinickia violacea TaxID=2571746 RepID=A0A4P8J1I8_9BURK|nr:LysR substrate-binding domain-containing protein [Trinickia violacea]QCP54215.1 LysR family transcriptional regulator [Trinickia violacea]